jgi:flagellar basal-body rod modification protein FlgD
MSSYIESLNQATTASTGKSTAKTTKDAVMGKEDFLKLLVAQLQNQDPLSPDDPTAFTAQLAQFSSLEQLTTLNASMDKLVSSNTSSQSLSTLSTIGKDVAYAGSSFNFTGDSMQLGYKLDGAASAVTLDLQLNGATVATLEGKGLGAGNHYMTWDGLTKDGVQAAAGNYKIVLQAKAADGKSVAASPLIRSEVTGVDLSGQSGGTIITKAGETPFNAILGIYDPSTHSASTTSAAVAKKETLAEVKAAVDTAAEVVETTKEILL